MRKKSKKLPRNTQSTIGIMIRRHPQDQTVQKETFRTWGCNVIFSCLSAYMQLRKVQYNIRWIMTRLTCPPFPPWCPSDKPQSRRPLVSSVRSSSCAAGCGWRCAGRQRPGQLPGPQPATRRARWREPCSTRPHSLSGNNTLRSTQASPGPLSPPRCGWDYKHKAIHCASVAGKGVHKPRAVNHFRHDASCVCQCCCALLCEEERWPSSAWHPPCDTRQGQGGRK